MRLEVFVADWSLWFNTGVFYVQMQSCLMQKNILKETNIVYQDICDFCLFILKQCMLVWLDGVILFWHFVEYIGPDSMNNSCFYNTR